MAEFLGCHPSNVSRAVQKKLELMDLGKSDTQQPSDRVSYLMILSACARTPLGGIVRPICLPVFRSIIAA